jgi:lauroyl/myristoyl acyltransferase
MMKIVPLIRFKALRALSQVCAPAIFYRLMLPLAEVRSWFKACPPDLAVPEVIGGNTVLRGMRRERRDYFLNNTLSFLPDQLVRPEWCSRCRFTGLEALQEYQRQGRPVVLAVCHFGPVYLLHLWLQAAGLPAATLVGGRASERAYLKRLKDTTTLFPDIPTVFYTHQMREVTRFLAAGNVLVIALDNMSGRLVEVPAAPGWNFQMTTGAVRLAARHRAGLFPCQIIDEGNWHFRVEFGRPVPDEYLTEEPDLMAAGRHLVAEWLPRFRSHPHQCTPMVFDSFKPAMAKPEPCINRY